MQHPLEVSSLPLILAGPILRHTEPESVTVWLALKEPSLVDLEIYETNADSTTTIGKILFRGQRHTIELGKHLHIVAVTARPITGELLQSDRLYAYNLYCDRNSLLKDVPNHNYSLSYFAHGLPTFTLPPADLDRLKIVSGSCRKPHGGGRDALYLLDGLINNAAKIPASRPHQLFLSGDQIYGDDVANPMLWMAQRVNSLLLGWSEELPLRQGTIIAELPPGKRSEIARIEGGLTGMLGGHAEKAKSHLFSFGEYAAVYLLSWSPVLIPDLIPTGEQYFNLLQQDELSAISSRERKKLIQQWETELTALNSFIGTLPQVRRALANVPVYTICDDHDVSDDWYLNREWCDRVLGKPLGKRIVQNAVLAYALFQAWGNTPQLFQLGTSGERLLQLASQWLVSKGQDREAKAQCDLYLGIPASDRNTGLPQTELDEDVLILSRDSRAIPWHYHLTSSKHEVIVVDTRTWRGYPSGKDEKLEPPRLLCPQAFKQQLESPLAQTSSSSIEATIIVLPTNLVTLKIIDRIQQWALSRNRKTASNDDYNKVFSTDVGDSWNFNQQAFVRLLLSLSQQRQRVIILSGDIHYSCAVRLTHWFHDPLITTVLVQLTSSAIKNSEPATLLAHTKLKSLFPEKTERWLGWNNPVKLKQIVPSRWRNRSLEQNSLPQWQYRVEWCHRKGTTLLPWQLPSQITQQSSWWQKLLTILVSWLWRNRWFQEGTEIVGRNNLSLIKFSWATNKAVIQESYWHPSWNDSAIVKSSYTVSLELDSLPPLPKQILK